LLLFLILLKLLLKNHYSILFTFTKKYPMELIKNYIAENNERFLQELFGLLRIPSVSAKEEHNQDMYKAAEYLRKNLIEAGADKAQIFDTQGHPVLYGEKIIDPSLPTILVYGHYDVQPAEPFDLWTSPAFEPEIRDDKIFCRGADDDKGQLFMHVKAFEFMNKKNLLKTNVKFMIEGEEEVGSVNLGAFCKEHKELLKCDIILVSDTGMIAPDIPSITVGLRGLAYLEVEVTGPNRDLHSGIFGGAVANPANVLAKMIASLTDAQNKITIPGFYDDVVELTQEQRDQLAKAPFNLENYKKALDLKEECGESGYTTIERTGIRPSLDVNGIWGGYTEQGAKTVLPAKAYAKISMRLVPNQDPDKIALQFEEHFKRIAPPYVTVNVTNLHGGDWYVASTDTIAFKAATKAYLDTFGKEPIPTRSGGSIPVIAMFDRVLGAKSLLMGFGLESDAIHSPNENFPLFNFYKGIETIPYFYKYFAELFNKE
jgi:acetylornithine deacetylase/succinyl-diaminopimelate desuccinylase-like protein